MPISVCVFVCVWSYVVCIFVCFDEQLTDELLVPDVQSHVPQRGGHSTDHPVVVYPQQLDEDREALLLTHCSPDIY